MRTSNERGIALITTLLVLMLMSALLVGFTTMVMSDQRYRFIDHDRGGAFYAASGAVEKITADLGNTFLANIAPNAAQAITIAAVASQPDMTASGISFTAATRPQTLPGSSLNSSSCSGVNSIRTLPNAPAVYGYNLSFCGDAAGNPTTIQPPSNIKTGPFEGLVALQTPYQIDVTAKTKTGGEVHLVRTIESVAIPVFQFGIFSDADLAFFAGPNFGFGGRVHTNGNLFLAQGGNAPGTNPCATALADTLTLSGKVTAVKEVIRHRMQNGSSIDTAPAHNGTVCMATGTGFRPLTRAEGSVKDDPGLPLVPNDAAWHGISLSTYNLWIRNTLTGAKKLNLPLTNLAVGGSNIDVIRRSVPNENIAKPLLYGERLYGKASLRILLSDTAADLTTLPQVDNTNPPVLLDGDWAGAGKPAGYNGAGVVDQTHPPIARSLGPLAVTTIAAALAAGATTITVNAMPGMFVKPQLMFKLNVAGGNIKGPFTCTGWTATTFTGCIHTALTVASQPLIYINTVALAVPALAGNMPGNAIPTRTLGANSAANADITLAAGQTTWEFAANTFWVNDVGAGGSGRSTLVTCAGANGLQFSSCTGVLATVANATVTTSYLSNQNIGTIGGYIKMDRQNTDGSWTDVTMEILNYGIGDTNTAGFQCGDPTPTAIVRLQRLRNNSSAGSCPNPLSVNSYEWWPNVLFDPREGLQRDSNYPGANNLTLGGVMHYVNIDARNLARWFRHATAPFNVPASTGNLSRVDGTGFTVYFSDRRNNRNGANPALETGEYGWEDFLNPGVANGVPNGGLLPDAGEDVNGNGALEVYGGVPNYTAPTVLAVPAINTVPPPNLGALSASSPLDNTARPTTTLLAGHAQVNRAIIFRRALMLSNGSWIASNPVAADRLTGLTIVSENPVYIRGDWNANTPGGTAGFTGVNAASAVIADAVTLLSNQWSDANSFAGPYTVGNRATTAASWYRLAIIAGKGLTFTLPTVGGGIPADFGTDGGAHNFLRFLENGANPVNYLGSLATLYYNRQAVGTYKCCATVYGAPARLFNFDVNFLNPALLPPNTPVFRDMNAVGFSQELRPGK